MNVTLPSNNVQKFFTNIFLGFCNQCNYFCDKTSDLFLVARIVFLSKFTHLDIDLHMLVIIHFYNPNVPKLCLPIIHRTRYSSKEHPQ